MLVEYLEDIAPLKMYTIEEVARDLKLNQETIRRYIRDGKLTASKFGNSYRITAENFLKFINDNLSK